MATAAKTGSIPGLKPIMMGLVGFPFLVRAWMGLCGQFHDIPYKDADCMLKLINETNKAHYDAHPLWPHLSYESDCDSVDYARKQAKENWHESKMMNAFVISEWALAAKWLLRDGLSFETLLFGWVAGMNTQYTMHYQHDLTQFVGNLVHHGGEGVLHWVLTFGMEYILIVLTFLTFAGYMAAAKAIKGGPVAKSVKTA